MKLTGAICASLFVFEYISLVNGQPMPPDIPMPPDVPFPGDDMPGGVSGERPASPEAQLVIEEVKGDVERIVGRPLSKYVAIRYRKQTVNGFNYWVKVDIGGSEFIHIYVYDHFAEDPELMYVHRGKTITDRISASRT